MSTDCVRMSPGWFTAWRQALKRRSRFGRAVVAIVSTGLLAGACNDPIANRAEAAAARDHLTRVVAIMEQHSVHRLTINWAEFRSTVRAAAPDPQDLGDTFAAIHVALGLLGDNHSFYTSPPRWGVTLRNWSINCTADFAPSFDIPSDIGYVRVSAFSGSAALATSYANALQATIRFRDATHPAGWIVDLRGNTGGNIWPMIAGLGPILGERTLGYSIEPDGKELPWGYRAGMSILEGRTMQAVASPYTLTNPDPRVAVLIDGRVVSSGEGTAIAFRARANTRFFGSATCGKSTDNRGFAIGDAMLQLTTGVMADRDKRAYGHTLLPDETITNQADLRNRAMAWIRGS